MIFVASPVSTGLLSPKSDIRFSCVTRFHLACPTAHSFIHSFIHSGHFYSAPSSPLLLSGAPDYSTDTVSEFHAEAHRQLQVKDLPKVPTWRLERESNPRPPVESNRLNQCATMS